MRATPPGRSESRAAVHGLAAVLAVLVAASALSSCSDGPDSDGADLSGSEAVSFPAADGVMLAGRVFGEGTSAVVLSHMRPADQTSWFGFADRLAGAGYLVFTFDFRGYCPGGDGGCSEGDRDIGSMWQDVVGAIDHVRTLGATSVSLVGASMGGTASLVAAGGEGVDVQAVITLSAPTSIEDLVVDGPLLTRIDAAKLFIAGVGDATANQDAETLYQLAPPPKRVEIVPSDDHGTDLLDGGQGEVVRRLIEGHLEQVGGP